ncbi:MAG: VOC family protein [Cyanobacteria bacterium P01_A01_bin.123]
MLDILRPLHVALLVSDLDQAEQFYGHVLGLPQVDRPLNFPGLWYQVGQLQLHLMLAVGSTSSPLHNAERWGRNAHLAFAVKDLEAAKTALLNAGFLVQLSGSGRAALFSQDPDGHVIELSQG